jgi:tripartite-type tricarboxylate transporter receptor subunit TctC
MSDTGSTAGGIVARSLKMFLCTAMVAGALAVHAQTYPLKPVRLIVPFSPGGGTDVATRIIAPKLTERFGQQIIVENRVGAAGAIGADATAKSAPDGYTLLVGSTSEMGISPSLYAKLPYDVLRDFAAVAPFAATPMVLVVTPSLPVNSTADLVKLARSRPGEINYGSAGAGTGNHMWSVMFAHMTGTRLVHVPYKGAAPAQTDVMSGQLQMMFSTLPAATPFVNGGRLKALAVSSAHRAPTMPNVPTVAESGVPGFEAVYWYGFFAPAATPKDVQARIYADTSAVLRLPEIVGSLSKQGLQPLNHTQEAFAAFIRAEMDKWGKVVKASGARVD